MILPRKVVYIRIISPYIGMHTILQLFYVHNYVNCKITAKIHIHTRKQIYQNHLQLNYCKTKSRLTIVSRKAKKKHHMRPLNELFTRSTALKFADVLAKQP